MKRTSQFLLGAFLTAIAISASSDAPGMLSQHFGIATLPKCHDVQGRQVGFFATSHAQMQRMDRFLGFASPTEPQVVYDAERFRHLPHIVQHIVMEHECGHKELGHVRAHAFSDKGGTGEEADCYAGLMLRLKWNYGAADFKVAERYFRYLFVLEGKPPEEASKQVLRAQACHAR